MFIYCRLPTDSVEVVASAVEEAAAADLVSAAVEVVEQPTAMTTRASDPAPVLAPALALVTPKALEVVEADLVAVD